jgi:methylenetetrahydrofolate reductase (NADPH)
MPSQRASHPFADADATPSSALQSAFMRLSVELVPRSYESLDKDVRAIAAHLPTVTTINIPDILRYPVRSWQGCAHIKTHFQDVIPHLRAIDFSVYCPFPLTAFLHDHHIRQVLVIAGDAPVDMSHTVYSSTTLDMIRFLRRELPELTIYAGLDPYRQNFQRELEYVRQKLDAGASGLFTQPFFDMRLMHIYAELLPNTTIFWGVTSVTSERSKQYWQARNRAVFPQDFEPTLAWNRSFAKQALRFVRERGDNLYFMPIRTGLLNYLQGLC